MHRRALHCGVLVVVTAGWLSLGCTAPKQPPAPVPVQGKVFCQDQPVPGVVLTFWPEQAQSSPLRVPTEPNGTFRLSVPPGTYKITVAPLPESTAPPGMSTGVADVVRAPVPAIASRYQNAADTPLRVSVATDGVANVRLQLQP